jgi:hypothetical protein
LTAIYTELKTSPNANVSTITVAIDEWYNELVKDFGTCVAELKSHMVKHNARKQSVVKELDTFSDRHALLITTAADPEFNARLNGISIDPEKVRLEAIDQGRDSPIFLQFFYLFSIFFLNRF